MYIFYALLTLAVLRATYRNGASNKLLLNAYFGFLVLSNSDNALASPLEFPLIFLASLALHENQRSRRPVVN